MKIYSCKINAGEILSQLNSLGFSSAEEYSKAHPGDFAGVLIKYALESGKMSFSGLSVVANSFSCSAYLLIDDIFLEKSTKKLVHINMKTLCSFMRKADLWPPHDLACRLGVDDNIIDNMFESGTTSLLTLCFLVSQFRCDPKDLFVDHYQPINWFIKNCCELDAQFKLLPEEEK